MFPGVSRESCASGFYEASKWSGPVTTSTVSCQACSTTCMNFQCCVLRDSSEMLRLELKVPRPNKAVSAQVHTRRSVKRGVGITQFHRPPNQQPRLSHHLFVPQPPSHSDNKLALRQSHPRPQLTFIPYRNGSHQGKYLLQRTSTSPGSSPLDSKPLVRPQEVRGVVASRGSGDKPTPRQGSS